MWGLSRKAFEANVKQLFRTTGFENTSTSYLIIISTVRPLTYSSQTKYHTKSSILHNFQP